MKRLLIFIISTLTFFLAAKAETSVFMPSDSLPAIGSDTTIVRFLESRFDVKFTGNNRVVLFSSGSEKFKDLFAAIRAARKSVHLEYFNFRNDSISKELFKILSAKAAEGVEVRA